MFPSGEYLFEQNILKITSWPVTQNRENIPHVPD